MTDRPQENGLAKVVTVLLVSRCGTLVGKVRQATEGLEPIRLQIAPAAEGVVPVLDAPELQLIILHLTAPQDVADAETLMRTAAALKRQASVVVIGEAGQAEGGLKLLRLGAINYLERPLDLTRLATLIDTLTLRARYQAARQQQTADSEVHSHTTADGNFIYCPSAAMGRVMDQVGRVAPVDTNVLLQGETGTGKTRLARVIHDLSPRRDGPFLVVNCAALSATLIESEMFGHVKGAFTGADRDRVGKFADAAGGTLFLDEIDSLPLELQAKLLRVVEDRVFEPVGTNRSQPMQARIIAASNRPLGREAEQGKFRSDLYFRLNVVTFEMPPLRERMNVFDAMVERFVAEFAGRAGRAITGVTPEAMAALRAYRWPGNVRELRNAVERAVALRPDGVIELDDLPDPVRPETASAAAAVEPPRDRTATLTETKEAAESNRIQNALRKNNNNRLRAASELGISRMTLYKKLHRYGLMQPVV